MFRRSRALSYSRELRSVAVEQEEIISKRSRKVNGSSYYEVSVLEYNYQLQFSCPDHLTSTSC